MRLVFIGIMCVVLACCATVKNAGTIAGTGTVVYGSFDGIYGIVEDNVGLFTAGDVVKLNNTGKEMIAVKLKLDQLVAKEGSVLDVVQNIHDLMPLYDRARVSYTTADAIIMQHIDEFSRADQVTLLTFQSTCNRLDGAIIVAMDEDTINGATVRDMMNFVFFVGKIVIPMIIL